MRLSQRNVTDSTNEDTTFNGSVSATDVDDTALTYAIVGATPAGVTFNSNGTFSVAPLSGDQALDTVKAALSRLIMLQ